MESRRKILLFRPDNIGDVVLFSGAFSHIRKLYPDDHITLAVQSHIVNLVQNCPYVDDVISVANLLSWKRYDDSFLFRFYFVRAIFKNIEKLYNFWFQPYDMVIYPVRSPQLSHLEILYYLSAKMVIGMVGCPMQRNVDYPPHLIPKHIFTEFFDLAKIDPWQHEFDTTAQFLRFLGCEAGVEDIQPQVWVTDADRACAADLMDTLKGTVIALFPGASSAIRQWSVLNYRSLAEGVAIDASYVIFGGPDEVGLAGEVKAMLGEVLPATRIFDLSGKTSLRQLYCCISRCNLLIGMETAGLHMAITAKIPTIGIVGGGHFGRFVPWGEPETNIISTNKMECFHCNWVCVHDSIRCIDGIDVESVVLAVNSLLPK